MEVQKLILENLIFNDEYNRKVLPFLKDEYFTDQKHKIVFDLIKTYFDKYSDFPPIEALKVELSALRNLDETTFKDTRSYIDTFEDTNQELQWLLDKSETFCQDKALFNALMKSIEIHKNEKGSLSKGAIPAMLQQALGVSFHTELGHDYIRDADERFEYYQQKIKKIPFDIDLLNSITDNGVSDGTLNMIVAGTGVGKTLMQCHFAAYNLLCGYNVMYLSGEMDAYEISRRIDANLLDIPIADLKIIPKTNFDSKIANLAAKTNGRLVVEQFPTSQAGVNHFRYMLNELKLKEDFSPDIIYVDYINLMASSRIKMSQAGGSYAYVKAIAEELRGLGVEHKFPVWSATQVNRTGFTDSDFGMEHTSESFGLPMTADFMIGAFQNEEMEHNGTMMIKQLGKNRYAGTGFHRKFLVGVDKTRMRITNISQGEQTLIDDAVFDKTAFADSDNTKMDQFSDFFK
jgi:replicative DNA helicase